MKKPERRYLSRILSSRDVATVNEGIEPCDFIVDT